LAFHVRRLEPSDRPALIALLRNLFPPDIDLDRRHQWLYEDNPHGRAACWLAIEEGTGRVVGCNAFFPKRLVTGQGEVLGALGGDGFVRPELRRQGIGAALQKIAREDMRHFGMRVMFGTPMKANFTPLQRAGGRNVALVATCSHPVDLGHHGVPPPFARGLSRLILRRDARLRLDPVTASDPRVDALWTRARPEIGIGTVRDAEFYAWRFVRSPSQRQKAFIVLDGDDPIAACAMESIPPVVNIIDLVGPIAAWGRALSAIVAAAGRCESVRIRLTQESALRSRLWRHGFLRREPHRPLNVVLPAGDPGGGPFDDASAWFVTWADTDVDRDV
jgi:predicted N-acetyltransferase YhbS